MKNVVLAVMACFFIAAMQTKLAFAEGENVKTATAPLKAVTRIFGYPLPAKTLPTGLKSEYSGLIGKYADHYGVPVDLAHAVISVESKFNAGARGGAGEVGLMQIKPATARMMGYRGSTKALYDPETNLRWGMQYLAAAYRIGGGEVCGAILRYNAGHAATRMNPVSKRYCGKVRALLEG